MMLPLFLLACCAVPQLSSPARSPQTPPRIVLLDDRTELDAALSARTPPRDVPVRLSAIGLPDSDPAKVRVVLLVSVADRSESSPLASIAYAVTRGSGAPLATALRRGELRRLPSGDLVFSEAIALPAADYRIRVAVLRNGRVGAAHQAFTARLQSAAPMRVGDLLIGTTPGDGAATEVLPDRNVRGGPLVVSLPVALEGPPPADLALAVEVARTRTGAPLLAASMTWLPGEGVVRTAQAILEPGVLPPGNYGARVVVAHGGKEIARVWTPFSFDRAEGAATPSGRSPATAPSTDVPGFTTDEVLTSDALGPFLDDLSARTSEQARPAIDLARAGRFPEAVAGVGPGGPDDPTRPFLTGLSLLASRQLQAASESFRDALRAAPDFFAGAFFIGACYAAGGRDPQAVNAWQTSLVGLEAYPIVFRLLGEAQMRLGQVDRAVETFDEALAKWPSHGALRLRAARASLIARRYDRTIELVDAGASAGNPDLLLVGLQAIYEQATVRSEPPSDALLARLARYRDQYAAAGGSKQALVAEWAAAVEKKAGIRKRPARDGGDPSSNARPDSPSRPFEVRLDGRFQKGQAVRPQGPVS